MHPDVAAACLPAMRTCELVDIRAEVADAVQRCSRRVGDYRYIGIVEARPGGSGRIELKPCGAKLKMVRLAGTSDAVCAVRDPLEQASIDQAGERRWRDACAQGLSSGNDAPLAFGYFDYPLKR